MGWSIGLIDNTVKIPEKCAKELYKALKKDLDLEEVEELVYDGYLQFNPDHMEHMDYIDANEQVFSILLKHKVNGDITFGSLDGDNAGSYWGYRFTDGVLAHLVGTVTFSPASFDEIE